MITADLVTRLRAALPPEVPVLLPEQQREPYEAAPLDAQGRPRVGGGERGLGAYLAQHPGGYVQVEEATPISSDGLAGTYWVAVAVIHSEAWEVFALAEQAYRAIAGWPYAPGHYREVTPGQPQQLAPGAWMVRRTFEAKTLDGQ